MTKRILILDAHPVYIHKIEGFLKGLAYQEITLASSGKEGLAKTISFNPDLVIMSGMLPDMNAHEVCEHIKKQNQSAKIIVQTGLFTDEKDIQLFKQQGADAVLERKEKDLVPLEETIAALLYTQ